MRGRIIPHLKSKYTTLLSMGVTSLKRISRAREDVALIDVFNLVGRKIFVKGLLFLILLNYLVELNGGDVKEMKH